MKILLSLVLFVGLLFASVDINNANEKEFTTLSGIGAKKAKAIVEYRTTNGCFKAIQDLLKVKGIGKKTIKKNKDNLELGKCPQ